MASNRPLTVVAPTPFFTEGGCSYRVLGETRAFARAGVPVRVLTYPSGRDLPGIQIIRPRTTSRKMGIGLNPIRPLYDLELLRVLLRYGRDKGTLHVHLHEGGLLGIVEKSLRMRPFVLDLEGSLIEEASRTYPAINRGILGSLGRRLEAFIETSAAQVVVSSSGLFEALSRSGHISKERLNLVPDGVDINDFVPKQAVPAKDILRWREAHGLAMDDILAVYVGGISPQQGIDDLLDRAPSMLAQAPKLRFIVFGVASQLNSLQSYVSKAKSMGLEKRVLFPGPLPFEQVPIALASSDIGLTWKYSLLEGSGKIPLYMAAGLPTVALNTPAHIHYLGADGSRGGIISADKDDAAKAVVTLALDEGRRDALGRRAREVAESELSWSVMAEKLLQIHDALAQY